MGDNTKTVMFMMCRHCDYVSIDVEALWDHFKQAHAVEEVFADIGEANFTEWCLIVSLVCNDVRVFTLFKTNSLSNWFFQN